MIWRLVVRCLVIMMMILKTQGSVNIIAKVTLTEEDVKSLNLTSEQQNPYFKILSEFDGELYIGGKRMVVIYNTTGDINDSKIINFANGELTNQISCENIASTGEVDKICQHYIRLAEKIVNENRTEFLFCGTNLLEPYCHYFNVSGTEFISDRNFTARRQVQYSVVQNSTAHYYGGALFVGYNIERRPNPSQISRYAVTRSELLEDASTDDQNENFVNEPHFVGKPYVHGDFMYFFYRETAVEAVNQGKFVYSRVGRLCLNDKGNRGEIQTYFKARLNCSLQGPYPFYFNHIQDVIVEEEKKDDGGVYVIFHAVFTTTPHGPASAAVCSYLLDDIIKVFETSKFKGKSSGKLPGPVDRPAFINRFIGCNVNSINGENRVFQERNALMDDLVPNYNRDNATGDSHPPLLYSTTMNFYSIAVDFSNRTDKIYYIGTEYGTILKAYISDEHLRTYEMDLSKNNCPVTGLHYNNKKLLAVTKEGLHQINLSNCASGCMEECINFRHGYCNGDSTSCYPTDVMNASPITHSASSVKILSLNSSNITSCANRKVELTCEVKTTSSLCSKVNLYWFYTDKEPAVPLVECSGDECTGAYSTISPFLQYMVISNQQYYKLVHLTITVFARETNGTFTCSADKKRLTKTEVDIRLDDSLGCLTKMSYVERKKVRANLQTEKNAFNSCEGDLNATQIMFQECKDCPGDPRVNL